MKYIFAAIMTVAVASPVFAAEYFIVRGADKVCKVVDAKPTDKAISVVGKPYATKDAADKDLKTACK
jgi:hypothetical protein